MSPIEFGGILFYFYVSKIFLSQCVIDQQKLNLISSWKNWGQMELIPDAAYQMSFLVCSEVAWVIY